MCCLGSTLAGKDDLELIAGSDAVAGLLATTTYLDRALLDLHLDNVNTPLTKIAALTGENISAFVYTSGDEICLVRRAASSGVMGSLRKNACRAELLDGIGMHSQAGWS